MNGEPGIDVMHLHVPVRQVAHAEEEPHCLTTWVTNANAPISATLLMIHLKKKSLNIIPYISYQLLYGVRSVDFNLTFVKNSPIFLAAFYFHLLHKEHQNFAILDKKLK